MKDASRVQAIIEIIEEVFKDLRPADLIIDSYFKQRRYIGSKDRRFIADNVWNIIRQRMKLYNKLKGNMYARLVTALYFFENDLDLLFNGEELGFKKNSSEFKLVVNIQDETHNFAINYHKQLRSKNMVHSKLDDIKGIGEIKKKLLLEEFKTIENIKNASVEELCKIKGINEELAKNIKISL